jgi:hypothetical protein
MIAAVSLCRGFQATSAPPFSRVDNGRRQGRSGRGGRFRHVGTGDQRCERGQPPALASDSREDGLSRASAAGGKSVPYGFPPGSPATGSAKPGGTSTQHQWQKTLFSARNRRLQAAVRIHRRRDVATGLSASEPSNQRPPAMSRYCLSASGLQLLPVAARSSPVPPSSSPSSGRFPSTARAAESYRCRRRSPGGLRLRGRRSTGRGR